jgi:hypothetical protein
MRAFLPSRTAASGHFSLATMSRLRINCTWSMPDFATSIWDIMPLTALRHSLLHASHKEQGLLIMRLKHGCALAIAFGGVNIHSNFRLTCRRGTLPQDGILRSYPTGEEVVDPNDSAISSGGLAPDRYSSPGRYFPVLTA